jgi:hypothetical protein
MAEFESEAIIAIGMDGFNDLSLFASHEQIEQVISAQRQDGQRPINDSLACWQFAHEMRPGTTYW